MRKLREHISIIIFVIYFLIGFFTYGYSYNKELAYQNKYNANYPTYNQSGAVLYGCVTGVIWPIYWPCHFSAAGWNKYFEARNK